MVQLEKIFGPSYFVTALAAIIYDFKYFLNCEGRRNGSSKKLVNKFNSSKLLITPLMVDKNDTKVAYQELCFPGNVVHTPPRPSEISMKNLRAKVIGEASFDTTFIIQNLNLAGLAVLVSW